MNNDMHHPTKHCCGIANDTPHLLHWITEPHEDTHRVIRVRRDHTDCASLVRITLAHISDPNDQVVLHALLLRKDVWEAHPLSFWNA